MIAKFPAVFARAGGPCHSGAYARLCHFLTHPTDDPAMQKTIAILAVLFFLTGRAIAQTPTTQPTVSVTVLGQQTCEKLGACQGASEHDGFVYLYGDANPGIIRQYTVTPGEVPRLEYTGLEISLTKNGVNLINHPTGLTWNPQFGTYLGNTVTATKKGTIYHLDWPKMLIEKNLNHAVLNVIDDDLAVQGCRPEFVRRGDNWYLATADYGSVRNAVRIYDPVKLATVSKTSEPGVLIEQHPCLPFVQQLHWIDSRQTLMVIQNQIVGRRWRLVPVDLWHTPDLRVVPPYDELPYPNELEGFSMIDPEHCVLVTSSRENNCTVGKIALK